MIHNDTYITTLYSNGECWAGPHITAKSFEEAEKYAEENEMGYLTIEGKLGFSFEIYELN